MGRGTRVKEGGARVKGATKVKGATRVRVGGGKCEVKDRREGRNKSGRTRVKEGTRGTAAKEGKKS